MITFTTDKTLGGKLLEVPAELRDEIVKYIRQAGKVRVVIAPAFQTRTKSQNAIFHAKINELSTLTGMDRDVIKDEVKEVALSMGYPPELDETGCPKVENGMVVPLSSAKATIEQFALLINAIDLWCEERDISLSDIWRI